MSVQVFGVDAAADESGDQIADRRSEKPDSHHLADKTARREFCHGRESDRAEQQLAKGLEEIAEGQPPGRDFDQPAARHQHIGREYHYEKSDAGQKQAESKLCRGGYVDISCPEPGPDPCKYGGKYDDKERIDRLEPKCRHLKRAYVTLGKILCKEIERGRGLFECRPKDRRKDEQVRR